MGNFRPLTEEELACTSRRYLDLSYANDSPSQVLDLFLPEDESKAPYPLIIHTHGGAFANGDQRENQTLPMLRGLKRGYAVASIQYRGSREAFFPAQLYDAKAAVRFLRAHADEYGLDGRRFISWGASSGGWLASMLGVSAHNPAFEDLSMGYPNQSSEVQAVIDWCGPCGDFNDMDAALLSSGTGEARHGEADSPESRFMGHRITEIPELTRLASPCSYVHAAMPPVLIVHGEADEVVPVEQSYAFRDAIRTAAGEEKVRLAVYEGKRHHGDPWYFEEWVSDLCFEFLEECF